MMVVVEVVVVVMMRLVVLVMVVVMHWMMVNGLKGKKLQCTTRPGGADPPEQSLRRNNYKGTNRTSEQAAEAARFKLCAGRFKKWKGLWATEEEPLLLSASLPRSPLDVTPYDTMAEVCIAVQLGKYAGNGGPTYLLPKWNSVFESSSSLR